MGGKCTRLHQASSLVALCDDALKDLKNLNVAMTLVNLMDVYPNLKIFFNPKISCLHPNVVVTPSHRYPDVAMKSSPLPSSGSRCP